MEVKNRVNVQIAAGERLYSRYDYRDFFRMGCADFIQPDVSHAGGISELRVITSYSIHYTKLYDAVRQGDRWFLQLSQKFV